MENIKSIRLINRALVKEGKSQRLSLFFSIMELAELEGIAVKGGTAGGEISYPFIEGLFPKKESALLAKRVVYNLLKKIGNYLHPYIGHEPLTLMELSFSDENKNKLGVLLYKDKKGSILIKELQEDEVIKKVISSLQLVSLA